MTLDIHVFGGKVGESIAVKFPNDKWAMVDCYSSSSKLPSSNAALTFLKERGVKSLLFFCLTHPHADHYSGARQIISEFNVDEFWHSPVMSGQKLQYILKNEMKRLKREREFSAESTPERELFELWKTIAQQGLTKKILTLGWQASHLDRFGFCEIRAIAPSGEQCEVFANRIGRTFEGFQFLPPQSDPNINEISIALRLRYGKSVIILGGDVEQAGWHDLLREEVDSIKQVRLFKVPHHGGTSGYVEEIWDHASTGDDYDVAILTPYSSKKLPRPEVIANLTRKGREVWVAGTPNLDNAVDSVETALAKLAPRNRVRSEGRVSIMVSEDGIRRVEAVDCARKL